MLDKATVLTTIFTIVDDTMKGSAVIQHALNRPGPAPRLSDSELVTIALYQELIGDPGRTGELADRAGGAAVGRDGSD